MAHHFNKDFFKAQAEVFLKAKVEANAHKNKTWKNLKNEEKDKIIFLAAQVVGVVPKDMVLG